MSLTYALRNANIIAVVGGPGAGKKTQCQKICNKFGYKYINIGDLLRIELTRDTRRSTEIKNLMANNQLVPRDYIENIIMSALLEGLESQAKGFIMDGYPRDTAQAESFQKKFKPFKCIIFLDVSTPTLTKRLISKSNASGKNDLSVEVIQRRLRNFKEISMPFIEKYKNKGICFAIDGESSEDVVTDKINKILTEHLK